MQLSLQHDIVQYFPACRNEGPKSSITVSVATIASVRTMSDEKVLWVADLIQKVFGIQNAQGLSEKDCCHNLYHQLGWMFVCPQHMLNVVFINEKLQNNV